MIELVGAGIGTVAGVDAEVFTSTSGDTTRVIVVREEAGTLAFTVELANTAALPTVRVREVSGPDDELRQPLTGYQVRFR